MAILPSDWLNVNRISWNQRTKLHINSDFYDVERFKKGKDSLNDIELQLLGNIDKQKILHLQCHFGMDTLSLERHGAFATGVDFSEDAISYANTLKKQMGLSSEFICSDIYDLDLTETHKFDMVFCSYGICGWLPDLNKWGKIISKHLQKGSTFTIVDFHPAVWMFDDDFKNIGYSYFNEKPYIEIESGSYASRNEKEEITSVWWNHSLSEIMKGLLDNDLDLIAFNEYDYSPYNCFRHTIEVSARKFRIKHLDSKIPMVYSMVFRKK